MSTSIALAESRQTLPMRIELQVDKALYYVGEDFPITVRIANPNGFDVYLRGFEFGPLEPRLMIRFPTEDDFQDFSNAGTISPFGGPPVVIPASGYIEHRRLVFIDTRIYGGHWTLMAPGTYRMRFDSSLTSVRRDNESDSAKIAWGLDEIGITLMMPSGRNALALEFLRGKATELAEQERNPRQGFETDRYKLRFYGEFLDRFGDTVYAPEIRWELTKLAAHELQDPHGPLYRDKQLADIFGQCLTYCLDRGGAYSDEFLRWELNRGGSQIMELLKQLGQFELFKRMADELDRKYPTDEEGKLLRRVWIEALTGDEDKARKIGQDLSDRFPTYPWSRNITGTIDSLLRQRAEHAEKP